MFKVFNHFNAKQRIFIFISLFFIVIQVWLDLKTPEYLSNITTLVGTQGSAISDVLIQGAYMLLCTFGSVIASMVVGYFAAMVGAGIAKTLRGKVYDKTVSLSMGEIDKFSTASLINRTTNDITQIQTLVATGLQVIIKAPILAVWAITKISGQNYQWTIATSVAVFIMMAMMAILLTFAVPRTTKIQFITDKLNRIIREQLMGIRVVRAYNAEEYQTKKFAAANDELTNTNLVINRIMALMSPTMTVVNSGLTLAIYWIGAYLIQATVINGRLELFSDMVVFSNYAMQVIMAFMMLTFIFQLYPRAQVSARRINEVLDLECSIADGQGFVNQPSEKGTIEFIDVSFKYSATADYVLKNISFKVNKGETVAFIGAIGSGKSTLINLIPRFYDTTEGVIKVDGVDVKDYKLKDLFRLIGYVPQKTTVFSGTVSTNVAYGDDEKAVPDTEIKQALSIAQAADFVEKMEGAYKAEIAGNGTNLSGGQKQRLSIARAIARNPEILIFDDSFSALDYKTDRTLRKALNDKTKETTKLIVAQRIGTIKSADHIIVLEHGGIAGKGTHDELMKTCETYQEIAYSQLSKEELENE